MATQSQAWKALERLVAKAMKGTRVLRGSDFSEKRVDVEVDDFPSLKIDAKYRQRWAHHKFVDEVETKYCEEVEDMPILVTKHPRQRGAIVTLRLDHFGLLLDTIRELRKEQEDLLREQEELLREVRAARRLASSEPKERNISTSLLMYWAGFFDGEGCIGIYRTSKKNKKRKAWSFFVSANQKNDAGGVVSEIAKAYEARVSWDGAMARCNLSTLRGYEFLRDVFPWLRVKAEQAKVFLSAFEEYRNGGGDEIIEVASDRLKELKR